MLSVQSSGTAHQGLRDGYMGASVPQDPMQALSEAQANSWKCLKIATEQVPSLSPLLLV